MASQGTIDRGVFSGRVIRPGDSDYDDARSVYNAIHDRRPALIVQAADIEDVRAAVLMASTHELPLAVRGGGHSVAGFSTCDDGLVLDLGAMREITVDGDARTVRAQGGCTWGELNEATHAFGLATTGGLISTTGIAGLTLGGGIGYLARRCGLACDNLISAEVVTAAGEVVTCSEQENAELLWALRGGGGNFGVVATLEYRLHPIGDVVGGPTVYELHPDVLRGFDELISAAPEDLGAVLGLALAPPFPFLPEEWHLRPVAVVISCWSGDDDGAGEALRPLRGIGRVLGESLGPMPYPVVNTLFDELLPKGLRHYWKSAFVQDIAEDALDLHVRHSRSVPTLESGTFFFPVDGACHRVDEKDTAFAFRRAHYGVGIFGTWPDQADDDSNTAWVRDYYDALRPHSLGGGYVNFTSVDEQGRVPETYGANHARLSRVKRRYDPENLFRLNQNIPPAAG